MKISLRSSEETQNYAHIQTSRPEKKQYIYIRTCTYDNLCLKTICIKRPHFQTLLSGVLRLAWLHIL